MGEASLRNKDTFGRGKTNGSSLSNGGSRKNSTVGGNGNSESSDSGGDDDDEDDDNKSLGSLFGDDEEEESVRDKSDEGNDVEMTDVSNKSNGSLINGNKKVNGNGADSQSNGNAAPQRQEKNNISHQVFLSSSFDGNVDIWDRRQEKRIARIKPSENVPPWAISACWSTDGNSIYVGRRNSCVEEYNIKSSFKSSRTFRFPPVSGAVSAVKSMPSGRHLLCGSFDNIRLYDLYSNLEESVNGGGTNAPKTATPFYIIPGHHGGIISSIFIDPSCQYMITTSGDRGWLGSSTDVALIYDITGIP